MMRAKPVTHVSQYSFGLIAGGLNYLHWQALKGLLDRLIPGLGVTMPGIFFNQDKVRDRLDRHQANLRMKGFIFTNRDLFRRHGLGQTKLFLRSENADLCLHRLRDLLLRAVGSRREAIQSAQLQKLADEADAAGTDLSENQMRGHHQPMEKG